MGVWEIVFRALCVILLVCLLNRVFDMLNEPSWVWFITGLFGMVAVIAGIVWAIAGKFIFHSKSKGEKNEKVDDF